LRTSRFSRLITIGALAAALIGAVSATSATSAFASGGGSGGGGGGGTTTNLGCGAMTNSQSISGNNQNTASVYAGGSSSVTASPISAVGIVPASNNFASGTVLNSYAIAQTDPYSSVGLPSGYSCSGQLSVGSNQNKTVQNNGGGVQCYRGMDLKGNVTFDPGTYVIDGSTGGSLNVGAGATVNCSACA